MMKLIRYFLFLFPLSALALVPVEGLLMGDAQEDIQADPLQGLFQDIYDKSQKGENSKLKLYLAAYSSGENLVESCSYLNQSTYASSFQESEARRTVAATLQYLGLDLSIKAIGAYAKKMEMPEEEFKTLSKNLVQNYCSKNMTVFSLRNIENALGHYYGNPEMELIPSVESSPFSTKTVRATSEKGLARSREFDLVLKNFRAFCSWGGEVEDYRMLTPYLNNRYIMSYVIKNLMGVKDRVDEKSLKVSSVPNESTVQVVCNDLICRKGTLTAFRTKFPQSVGSTGIFTDLSKLYCHHFRFQDPPKSSVPQVRAWLKEQELEDPVFETSQMIALLTGVPDFMQGLESYSELPLLARSSVEERWTLWAKKVLDRFSKDLLYEESLKIKVEPRRDRIALRLKGFLINLQVSLGEMDRLMVEKDKLSLGFEMKISKNYLRYMRSKWSDLEKAVDMEGKKAFKEEVAAYLDIQLKEKEKLLSQKVWNASFAKLMTEELLQQVLLYNGPLFDSYKDEVLTVPVRFSYGVFALGYLKYKADVAAGRLKLNL
jgi:hypothetical protein